MNFLNFLSTIQFTFQLLIASGRFLRKNKDLLFFPIISMLATFGFFLLCLFSTLLNFEVFIKFASHHVSLAWITLLLTYFLLSFIVIYFNSSLIACCVLRLQGESGTLGDGLGMAAKRWWALLKWSLVSTTIGGLIHLLERSHNFIAEIVGYFLGGAWTIGAFFVVPVLLFENVGPFGALKRGYSVLGRGWKKVVAINAFFGLALIAVIFILKILAVLFPALFIGFSGHAGFWLIDIGITILAVIFFMIIANAFNAVACSALYINLMQEQTPEGFDPEVMQNAFQQR